MPSDLEISIFRTVAYFAHFQYPLTAFEIGKWLLSPGERAEFSQVFEALHSSLWLRSQIASADGFHGIGKVELQVADRRARLADALRKYAKVHAALRILGRIPSVDGIAICNSLAFHHTDDESDIDLFIVAKPGSIWSVRLFSTLPFMLLGDRPGKGKKDPICLSFFATPKAFAFEHLKINDSDPYLAYWSASLAPLVDRTEWHEQFVIKNAWVAALLPNAYAVKRAHLFKAKKRTRIPAPQFVESFAKQLQANRFPAQLQQMMNKDSRVIVNDLMLKFHENDRRQEFHEALEERMRAVV